MKLVKTMTMPSYMQTKMDHLAVDVKTHRVMEAVEGNGVVPVFNYQTGKLIHVIKGLKRPHAFLIRDDINRLFVDDDVLGGIQIYNLNVAS